MEIHPISICHWKIFDGFIPRPKLMMHHRHCTIKCLSSEGDALWIVHYFWRHNESNDFWNIVGDVWLPNIKVTRGNQFTVPVPLYHVSQTGELEKYDSFTNVKILNVTRSHHVSLVSGIRYWRKNTWGLISFYTHEFSQLNDGWWIIVMLLAGRACVSYHQTRPGQKLTVKAA